MPTLKIHLTYQCTSECEHCRFRCTRDPAPAIGERLAIECMESLRRINGLDAVVLMGGEPGLHPDLMHSLASAASGLGAHVRVETNAFWAQDEQAAKQFLEPLYGMDASVMFSLDAFHEPFIPPERVETAVRASDELKGQYIVDLAYFEGPQADNEWDTRTRALLAELEAKLGRSPCSPTYQGSLFFTGRSTDELARIAAVGRGVPTETCDCVPWWHKGEIETLDLLMLDPEGYISKGCGIAIGNAREQSVAAILDSYNPRRHPILSTLLESGPLGLAKEAEELGFVIGEDYADKCHLCQEAREALRGKYPEWLVPTQHYRAAKT